MEGADEVPPQMLFLCVSAWLSEFVGVLHSTSPVALGSNPTHTLIVFFVIELTQIPNFPLNLTLDSEIEQKFEKKKFGRG